MTSRTWRDHPDADSLEREAERIKASPPYGRDNWRNWGDLLAKFATAKEAQDFAADVGITVKGGGKLASPEIVANWRAVARAVPPDVRGECSYGAALSLYTHVDKVDVRQRLREGIPFGDARSWADRLAEGENVTYEQAFNRPAPVPRLRGRRPKAEPRRPKRQPKKNAPETSETPWPADPDEPFYRWNNGAGAAVYQEARSALIARERVTPWRWADWFAVLPAEYAVDFAETLRVGKPPYEVKRFRKVALEWPADRRGIASFDVHRILMPYVSLPDAQQAVQRPLLKKEARALAAQFKAEMAERRKKRILGVLDEVSGVGVATPHDFELLGVARPVTRSELHRAYRRLALEIHPDKRPADSNAPHEFDALKKAYERVKRTVV